MEKIKALIDELNRLFEELNTVEEQKIKALKEEKVSRIEECMKKEQVLTLQFRSCEKKAEKLMEEGGTSSGTLRGLVEQLSPKERHELWPAYEKLQNRIRLWQEKGTAAEELLKLRLYHTGKRLAGSGIYDPHGAEQERTGILRSRKA